jgi:uncharacterized protein YbaR (Trm112 family)
MVEKALLDIVVCSWCLGDLEQAAERLRCRRCGAAYRIVDDIPNMLVEDAELPCGLCSEPMSKRPPYAVCERCGVCRRMDVRIEGAPADHVQRFCAQCGPDVVLLRQDGDGWTCPQCGARPKAAPHASGDS